MTASDGQYGVAGRIHPTGAALLTDSSSRGLEVSTHCGRSLRLKANFRLQDLDPM